MCPEGLQTFTSEYLGTNFILVGFCECFRFANPTTLLFHISFILFRFCYISYQIYVNSTTLVLIIVCEARSIRVHL